MGNLTFMLWGHIFGTCQDWCSEFSCTLRVESHVININFYVCSFNIPYAKPVWPSCQHTSQIWVTGCFPLVHSLLWRASRGELFGSFTQAASCFAHECVVLHEWRRGCALKCISCCMWMQVWLQSQELLMVREWLTEVSSNPGGCTVLGTIEFRSIQSRNAQPTQLTWETAFSFSETEMLPSHC